MASSDAGTSSGKAEGGQYQVFLNFHGRDTRVGFTSFLYRDLTKNGIYAFMDDEELRVGEEIGEELLRAIDDSRIYIPIFSKNYADSKWCLRELARMVNNTTTKSEEKKIMPVFYDVEPDDVALKTSLYRTTIEKHKKEFPHDAESWEEALKKVDKIKGWVLPKCKNQAELVDLVVEEVLQELKIRYKSVTEDLVGLEERAEEVLKLLDVDCSDEVRLLGIHGMGGIGKTTIAKVVYNKLSSRFGKCCAFLDDVRETLKKEGLVSLQKKLLRDIDSSVAAEIIKDVDHGRGRMEATLGSKKVLIVLDDIDEKEQIENLIGRGRLHPGTRIIITTRNTGVLKIERRMAREIKEVNSNHALQIQCYEMEGMKFDHAFQLFKRHAFGEDSSAKDFDSLSIEIVKTTGGLPLALTVIGSFLNDKKEAIWKEALDKLKDIPDENVQEKLMISYDALNSRQREIFLDVACFFINEYMTNPIYMWDDCKFYPNMEIDVLVRMSLIKILDDKFWMHDQLRDLGREIVRRGNSKNLKKQSRVWTSDEFCDFVRTEQLYEDVEALDLQWRYNNFSNEEIIRYKKCRSNFSISHEEIRRLKNLRFLSLSHEAICGDFTVSLPKMRWFSWHSARQDVGGLSMHSKKLVVLELFDNDLTNDSKVWDLIKMATKLKKLTLRECRGIIRTPDLSKCLDLERLTFQNCTRLKEIDDSIGKLKCLLDLEIYNCGHIERVPGVGGLVKLERFTLSNCYEVTGLPASIGNLASLRKLDLSYTRITSLPESIGDLASLRELDLSDTRITTLPESIEKLQCLSDLSLDGIEIRQLPNSIGKLTSLRTLRLASYEYGKLFESIVRWELPKAIGMLDKLENLYLGYCNELVGQIPDEIGNLSSLRVLDLCGTRICRVPGTINRLSCLSTLDLTGCNEITELFELPVNLVYLYVQSSSLQVVPNLSELTNLVELVLSDGSEGQDLSNLKHTCDLGWVGMLSKLKKLELCLLNIAAPPTELGLLSLLEDLTLFGLDLQPLEQLPPSLHSLELDKFSSIGPPQSNLKIPSKLRFRLSRLQEIQLYGFSQLQDLYLERCDFQSLSIPSSVRILKVKFCPNMIEIRVLGMPASLEELDICWCESIGRMVLCGEGGSHGPLDQSKSSSSRLIYCSPGVLLPNAFKKLKKLKLSCSKNLLEIQVIGTLLSLQDISIRDCDAIEKLTGISNLKNLRHLKISSCLKLWVVEGLDKLEFLTDLEVSNCFSLETLLDISNSKISDECKICIYGCGKWFISSHDIPFKRYKEMMVQQGAPQSKTNKKKAKMEGDAKEPNTKLPFCFHPFAGSPDHYISEELPWFHPFAGCQDHYISEELPLWFHQFPPIDNVKEGTLPGNQNQNQTRQQDLNPLSISPLSSTELQLQFHPSTSSQDHEVNEEPPTDDVREGTLPGNQNQTREQDSNPQSNSPLSSTELQLQFHPSGSRDHEINQESPIDDVREGTLPGNQNQTREQDSNPQSNSPLSSTELQLQFHPSGSRDHEINEESPIDDGREGTPPGNQNQTREQDLNPQSNSQLSSTELQLQFHPSGSRDHEINEESPIDDVREGTLPGNQNQTWEQDSNSQSNSPLSSTELQLQFHPFGSRDHEINEESPIDDGREGTLPGNQNRMRESDSKPQSLDELARPRTFSDSFKACLVSILECVCNGDFT